jgi:MFS transporter, UMF1 family
LLIINLLVILKPTIFGIAQDDHSGIAARIAFLTVGFWWFGFAQIPFRRLPKDKAGKIRKQDIYKGFEELKEVWQEIKNHADIKQFLKGFFFYNAGVQSILFLAGIFAAKELNFESSELIILILLLQLVGIAGAYLFAYISKIKGNKFSIIIMLFIWICICVAAFRLTQKLDFYILGCFVGMVMGGIQSMSRSTYSKLIPEGTQDTATYFSFMDVIDKISIILGTFSFGIAEYITGNIRYSLLVLALFFVIGLFFIWNLKFVFKKRNIY